MKCSCDVLAFPSSIPVRASRSSITLIACPVYPNIVGIKAAIIPIDIAA
jgi:hypothetical protein